MKILHLAAGNRWTGAAAPAFAEVEALRCAGVEAHYAYVGGYRLESKISAYPFAHPIIRKAQNPVSFARSVKAIRRLIADDQIDTLHAHLTYDHFLARMVALTTPVRIARTFHSRRTLRNDLFTSALLRRTDAVFVINETFADAEILRGKNVTFTPPPLDRRLFKPDGPTVRAVYGLESSTKVIAVVGKLSPDRGFEDALRTFALVHDVMPAARLMVIGQGLHRRVLEQLAHELGLDSSVIWAGYHENDLPEHYRTADLLLFTSTGSDEGHRAVIEALGCGLPPAVFPIPGVQTLLGALAPRLVAAENTPEALASVIVGALASPAAELARAAAAQAEKFTYQPAAERLLSGYGA